MRLIDAEALKSYMDECSKESRFRVYYGYAESFINDAPTIDAVPVVHGRWITTSGEVFPGSSQFLCYSHKHEECGFQYVDLNENEYDYCPNCGCRMDLEG